MSTPIQPWTFLVVAVAGWIQRDQQAAIVYLLEENRVLKARLRGRKLRFTDDERRRLSVKGKALGRNSWQKSPDSSRRKRCWPGTEGSLRGSGTKAERRKQLGRPRVMVEITELVVAMAKANPKWGYTRIRGAISNLGL